MTEQVAILVAGVIAFAMAGVELLARYRDDPRRAVLSTPALVYAVVNGSAGLLTAWWIARFFPALVTKPGATGLDPTMLAVTAGLSSLVILRASLLKLKVASGQDISVGPAVIVEQLLSVIDRGIDRHLADHRGLVAAELADKFVWERDHEALVSLCFVLLQNPTLSEEQEITAIYRGLASRTNLDPQVKKMMLLLALLGVVGERVLRQAVKSLQVAERPANPFAQAPSSP